MKISALLALTLAAGALAPACAQLETCSTEGLCSPEGPQQQTCCDAEAQAPAPATCASAESACPTDSRVNTVQAIPSGERASSALLLSKSLPAVIQRDESFDYQLVVENLGQDPLANVRVQEQLPASLNLISADPAAASSEDQCVIWELGTLAAGETKTITITAMAVADGASSSYAMVSYDRTLKGQFQVVSPALTLDLTGPETTVPGETFEFQLTVNNTGTGTARNVDLSAVLPEGLQTTEGENSAKMVLQELAAGESHTLTIEAQATRPGTFETTAQASMQKGDPVTVTGGAILVQDTRLELTTSGPSKFFLGQPGKIILTVKNVGASQAEDVKLEQALPEGLELVRSSIPAEQVEGVMRWNLGHMEAGAETSVTLYLTPSHTGTLDLAASAQASKGSPAESKYTAPMEGISALHFTIEDLQDPVPVGESLTYHIKVHNQGTAPGANIAIVVTMDEGMQLVHAKGPTNGHTEGNKIIFNALESLDPDATATWRLVLQSSQIGDLRLSAALTSKRLQRPVEVTQSTQFYQ